MCGAGLCLALQALRPAGPLLWPVWLRSWVFPCSRLEQAKTNNVCVCVCVCLSLSESPTHLRRVCAASGVVPGTEFQEAGSALQIKTFWD